MLAETPKSPDLMQQRIYRVAAWSSMLRRAVVPHVQGFRLAHSVLREKALVHSERKFQRELFAPPGSNRSGGA